MQNSHAPDWIAASAMLREAMELYRDQHYYTSLPRVVDDLIDYIEKHSGKWLSEKTIRRDSRNTPDSKTVYQIPDWRVRLYAKWLYEEVGKDREWLAAWLEHTAYSAPGKLLAEIRDARGDIHHVYRTVKTNVPSLNTRLWGRFLGRQEELANLRKWADQQRHPIAVLYGFGGSGKTTLQQKMGHESVHGIQCPLRWPYDGVVWMSAVDYPAGQPELPDVLRKVAYTFDLFEGYTGEDLGLISPQTIKAHVMALLENQRILVLLDNFETIALPAQRDILHFFHDLHGSSQLLISSRYRPDWLLEQDDAEMYRMAHVLIRVDGLSSQDAKRLIQDFLDAKSLPPNVINDEECTRLIAVTRNNPKTILTVLGLMEQGLSLSHLLDAMISGTSAADTIYDTVIDRAWQDLLTESNKAVLMAKALFRHSVNEDDLGQVAGVSGHHLRQAIKTLAAISFFEMESRPSHRLRIHTHPLAQEFARRILHEHPEFKQAAEERWWQYYGPAVVQQAGQTPYEALHADLKEDIANVVDHVESHVRERSAYSLRAAKLFGGDGGLGSFLAYWGEYDEVLRVAKAVLEIGAEQRDPELLGECGVCLVFRIYIVRREFDEADRYLGVIIEHNSSIHDPWLGAMIEFGRILNYSYRGYKGAVEEACKSTLQRFIEVEDAYYTALTYQILGDTFLNKALDQLSCTGIDSTGQSESFLTQAEAYVSESARYLTQYLQQAPADLDSEYTTVTNRFLRGRIARVRGQLSQARDIFEQCLGKFPSLWGAAHVYCEMALVEHLDGNRSLAYAYEEKGLTLFRKFEITTPTVQCYQVITSMKERGTW